MKVRANVIIDTEFSMKNISYIMSYKTTSVMNSVSFPRIWLTTMTIFVTKKSNLQQLISPWLMRCYYLVFVWEQRTPRSCAIVEENCDYLHKVFRYSQINIGYICLSANLACLLGNILNIVRTDIFEGIFIIRVVNLFLIQIN